MHSDKRILYDYKICSTECCVENNTKMHHIRNSGFMLNTLQVCNQNLLIMQTF